jgi:hypothetical protein
MDIRERVKALVEPFKADEARLLAQREELQVQLAAVNEGLREIQKWLKLVDPEAYAVQRGNGSAKVSDEYVNRVFRAMWSRPEKVWSQAELQKETGIHQGSVSAAMQVLRARGDVRNMGRIPKRPGQVGQAPLGFKVAETATPPGAEEKMERLSTQKVSSARLEEAMMILRSEPEREWTRRDVEERVDWHKSAVGFVFNQLVEEGKIEDIGRENGGHAPTRYKVVTDSG